MNVGARQRFGTYVARDSLLHRLDPLMKLSVFLLVVASIFLSTGWTHVGLVSGYVLFLCVASRVGFGFYVESIKYFSWMFALSFAINAIFPRDPSHQAFSLEALGVAGVFSVRLALMIVVGTVLTVTTAPSEFGESLLAFSRLKGKMGRKVADLATVLSISLRFIPVMFEEAERIRIAQKLRGLPSHGLRDRVNGVVKLVVPLIDSSLRRSTNLGFALEARCYGYRVPAAEGVRFGVAELIFGLTALTGFVCLLVMR